MDRGADSAYPALLDWASMACLLLGDNTGGLSYASRAAVLAWGFAEAAHFSRVFKAAYGEPQSGAGAGVRVTRPDGRRRLSYAAEPQRAGWAVVRRQGAGRRHQHAHASVA